MVKGARIKVFIDARQIVELNILNPLLEQPKNFLTISKATYFLNHTFDPLVNLNTIKIKNMSLSRNN